jgi:thiol-disulfide isomerase/thioredoxin
MLVNSINTRMKNLLKDPSLLLLVLLFFLVLIVVRISNSSFGSTPVPEQDIQGLDKIPEGKTAIFFASWCGHCRASMNEFKKAVQDSNGLVIMIPESNENRKLMKNYKIQGFPTIVKSDGTVYTGSRKAQDIIDFANGK